MQTEIDLNKQTAQAPMFFSVQKMKSPKANSKSKQKVDNNASTSMGDAIEFIDSDVDASEHNNDAIANEHRQSISSTKENGKNKVKLKKSRSKKSMDLNGSHASFGFGDFDDMLNEDGSERTPPNGTLEEDSFTNLQDSFSSPRRTPSGTGALRSPKAKKKKDALNGSSSPRRKREKGADQNGENAPRSPSKLVGAGTPGKKMIAMQPKMVKQKSQKSKKAPSSDGFHDSGDMDWFFPEAATTSSSPRAKKKPSATTTSETNGTDPFQSPPASPRKSTALSPTPLTPDSPAASPGKVKKSRPKSSRRSSMVGRVELSGDENAADLMKAVKEGAKKSRRRSYAGDKKPASPSKSPQKLRRGSGAGKTHSDKLHSSSKLHASASILMSAPLSPLSPVIAGTKQRKPPRDLFSVLDFEPWSSDNTSYSDAELIDAIEADPESVKKKYRFEFFGVVIYPFSMMCAIGSSVEAIKLCHKVFPEALHEKDPWVGSPLHYACGYEGPPDVVDWLVENGPEMTTSINRLKRSPFHIACQFNPRLQILNSLLRTAPKGLEVKDKYGCTPLHLACENNAPPEVLEMMIGAFPEGCLVTSQTGATPLHMALENRVHLPKIKLLVKAQDSVLEVRDVEGRCPLHTAVENECDIKIVKYLLKHNANTLNIKTEWLCETPLEMAKRLEASSEVIALLRSHQGQ